MDAIFYCYFWSFLKPAKRLKISNLEQNISIIPGIYYAFSFFKAERNTSQASQRAASVWVLSWKIKSERVSKTTKYLTPQRMSNITFSCIWCFTNNPLNLMHSRSCFLEKFLLTSCEHSGFYLFFSLEDENKIHMVLGQQATSFWIFERLEVP